MTFLRLIFRNLVYYRGVNLAVIAGVAVATAVLSGALLVGDSVRESLEDLAVQRLGKIDYAVLSPKYFDAALVDRLQSDPELAGQFEFAPAILTRGGAALDNGTVHAAGLQILAAGKDWAPAKPGEVLLNSEAADSLQLSGAGADVVLTLPAESEVPLESTLARRSRQDSLAAMRARVAQIVHAPGMLTLFTPDGGQRIPSNAWVQLNDLQRSINQPNRINTILVHDNAGNPNSAADLAAALKRVIRLSDFGLTLMHSSVSASLGSRTTYIDPPVEVGAEMVAERLGINLQKISVNLINSVSRAENNNRRESKIHYAVAAGISDINGAPLADDEIILNEWSAQQLSALVGDRISLTFYRRRIEGGLTEVADSDRGFVNHFRVAKILPMTGIGADPSLTPSYAGLTDSDSIRNWNPPAEVKIDKSLVTDADEAYWKAHKAAPKLFVSFDTAQRLWGVGFANATSLRIPVDRATEFENALLAAIDPSTMGLFFRPLRAEQLAAANGPTDFAQLFLAFSFFLILSAALLVAMLMRLSVEQRARQLGALSAIGFSEKSLRAIVLREGMILSILGGLLGSLAGIGYTWLMIAGLRTWWIGAIGTTAMHLHVSFFSLGIGFLSAEMVAMLAILWAVRQIGKASPARLLAGGWEAARPINRNRGRIPRLVAAMGFICGLAILFLGAAGHLSQQSAFLSGGGILLAASLFLVNAFLQPRSRERSGAGTRSIVHLGVRNASRHPARSVLSIGLIALAAFALVTVAAMRQGAPSNTADRKSGAGGFRLIVDSEIPLLGNPATYDGRELLGFRDPGNALWDRLTFLPLRRRHGQDISCLNLTRATTPTITAVPKALLDRNGFTFASFLTPVENPWTLLNLSDESDVVPVITDDNTAKYILHLSLGDTLDILDSTGQSQRLRLVATLASSVFQGELLMGEQSFQKLFPAESGFGAVLIEVSAEDQEAARRLLSEELNDYAASVHTTASILAGYLQVQNTYLSTFQLLGALGLMLGTIGLAVVLVRTVIERRAELALLASLGFTSGRRAWLVLSENIFLLVAGLIIGTTCALIGVWPAIRVSAREINFLSLALTLLGVLVVGLVASTLAVLMSGLHLKPADLRRE